MLRLGSQNTLTIALCKALAFLNFANGTRHKNLTQTAFVTGFKYFKNKPSSDVSNKLVDSSALSVFSNDSSVSMTVLISLFIADCNSLNGKFR